MEAQFSHKRHQTHHPSHSNYTPISQQHTKPSITGETQFRILCPAAKVGGVIGKGGAVIQQLRDDTGARIRIVDEISPFACYDERVILIVADSKTPNPNDDREEGSAAQFALLKVFERILKVDEERSEEERKHYNGNDNNSNNNNNVVCRLLAPINQVGCVIGRGGKIVEKIRQESGAQVRILPREQIPACASPGEELIQMTGNFQAVKKALLSVSSCLQEHPRADMLQGANSASQTDSFPYRGELITDHHSRSFTTASASENIVHNHRMIPEEDVIFRLLCPGDKFGILTGKGGSIVNAIQKKTGASIKIGDLVAPDADEWIVYISARESMDLKCSPAQDALIRVHSRLAEVRFEPGATVTARLLVPSQHIGCLLGKGGIIITEMRRLTGASIRIFDRENGLNFKNQNDELVQVIGSLQSVQDALYQITSRLREILFPLKRHFSHVSSSPYFTNYQESSSPSFRPRHDQASPVRYQSPAGLPNAYDYRSAGQVHAHPSFSHDLDRIDVADGEIDRYHYGGDRGSYGSSFERPSSPNIWHPQAVDYVNSGRFSDVRPGPGPGSGSTNILANNNESGQMLRMTSVEVVIPQILLPHVYGENKTNLGHITQFSGADVTIHDPKPGATEGHVIISGTPHQLYAAQSLVQAFILCGQAF